VRRNTSSTSTSLEAVTKIPSLDGSVVISLTPATTTREELATVMLPSCARSSVMSRMPTSVDRATRSVAPVFGAKNREGSMMPLPRTTTLRALTIRSDPSTTAPPAR
jgi:hypothetical protein